MDTTESDGTTISVMLLKLKMGDEQAAFELWERFFHQLLSSVASDSDVTRSL